MSEEFYDEHIAPGLADLADQCKQHGMTLLAFVEWQPGESGLTRMLGPSLSFEAQLALWAMHARGNIDSLMISVMRYAREHGHSSLILKQLGVPLSPSAGSEPDG